MSPNEAAQPFSLRDMILLAPVALYHWAEMLGFYIYPSGTFD